MTDQITIDEQIKAASSVIGKAWPLYAFVTSNPLSGFEDQHFEDAIQQARELFHAHGLPSAQMLRKAWDEGHIKPEAIQALLKSYDISESPEAHLQQLEKQADHQPFELNPTRQLDRLMAKWLTAFMDEDMAEWRMPGREHGFYSAWRDLAPFDQQIPKAAELETLPRDLYEALNRVLKKYPEERHQALFTEQLAALPGLTGMILYRQEYQTQWQQRYPITLVEMLAVRLTLAHHMGYDLTPHQTATSHTNSSPIPERLWLLAWEKTYQDGLVEMLRANLAEKPPNTLHHRQPEAQLVFCIDTRSEVIRRHIEQAGDYETFGYAGFFGIPMNYQPYHSNLVKKACPPILSSAYEVTETAEDADSDLSRQYDLWTEFRKGFNRLIETFTNNVPASFGYVEGTGAYYGLSMTARTLIPKTVHRLVDKISQVIPDPVQFCSPTVNKYANDSNEPQETISLEAQVGVAKTLFDLTGWQNFAPLVVLTGHGSNTQNNPFGSSLDCGACAGNPGRHNARTLAKICNDPAVRQGLQEAGITIPEETVFIAAEHNTTTDAITLFDQSVPATHQSALKALKADLAKAQKVAAEERVLTMRNRSHSGMQEVQKRSSDWAETRPEWGLAGNAAFIIGPRSLTEDLNLEGRCFLHTYDWYTDPEGKALEAIMSGPMVVTQWINNHYYFASVDNNTFGSGSKVTQNVTGKFGVVQGNGGDLKTGLPLQSLNLDDNHYFHQPLRLMVLIHAPARMVQDILNRNQASLGGLFDNEWLHLRIMDPEQGNKVMTYREGFWKAKSVEA